MKHWLGILIIAVLALQTAALATDVSGNVSGTWTLAGSPYMVMGNVTVPSGQTLTIEPGVQVRFTGHYKFTVNDVMRAIGTEQDSIYFSHQSIPPGIMWSGLRMYAGSDSSVFAYCVFEYGRADDAEGEGQGGAMRCIHSAPTISHCTFRNNQSLDWGGALMLGWSDARVTDCAFIDNSAPNGGGADGGAVFIYVSAPLIGHCLFSGNTAVQGGAVFCYASSTPTIQSCTFTANSAQNGIGGIQVDAIPLINNCIFESNGVAISAGVQEIRYCDFFGNVNGNVANPPAGFGDLSTINPNGTPCDIYSNIFLNPMFVDAASRNYALQAGSPCINAGDPSLPYDPDGSIADIGAFARTSIPSIHLLIPNGGQTLRITDNDSVRWGSFGFEGSVRLELNRDYPGGVWEMIAESTANDGQEPWVVTGPPSSQCRVRISAVSDTLSDASDADFSIVSWLNLACPNGGEDWSVFHTDTLRWNSGGFSQVRIELNRNYPTGTWELLRDSTANDGVEAVYVTDPLSTHCRVRISAIGDTLSDVSDEDFAITASQGYLALVRGNAPNNAVLGWNPAVVECPQVASEWFHLKNFGSEALVTFQPLEPASAEFGRVTSCGTFFALAPGQMSACSLTLSFDAASDGTYSDTLRIQTDAVNGVDGYVRIPLAGTQISTPAVPQVVIQPQGEDIHLAWQPVTQSGGGCPVNVTRYLVFYSPTNNGPYYYHGFTAGTAYTHVGAVTYAAGMYYQVTAYTGALSVLEGIAQGEEMGMVMKMVGNGK